MKKLGSKGMKVLKTFHLLFIMLWVVGVIAMAVVNLIVPHSGDELYMTLYVNRIIDDALVIPGAMLTVVTAILYGIFTGWGFFKQRWITVKWVVSLLVILFGTFYFNPKHNICLDIADRLREAAFDNPEFVSNHQIVVYGSFIQAAVLIFLIVISVFKPWKKKKAKQ